MSIKKIIGLLLAVMMILSASVSVCAAEDEVFSADGVIKILDMNVDGLPVPAGLSKDNKSPINSAHSIIEFINANNADIVSTQENFNFFPMYKTGLNYDNITSYNGGAAVGDGLAVASKYKIYNVKHVAWDTACGVLDRGSDELTPKGFMVATIEIADGVYIDYYTLHADACEDEGSLQAKRDQFDQLCEFMDNYSEDRAVILAGDFNSNYTIVLGDVLRDKFVARGFKDTWVEVKNDDDYNPSYSELYEKYGKVNYWGYYDCLDKVYYRDGANLQFSASEHDYVFCYTNNKDGERVLATDHAAILTELEYKIVEAQMKPVDLKAERRTTIPMLFFRAAKTVIKDIILLIKQIPGVISGEIKLEWMK